MGDYCTPPRGTMEIMLPEGHIMPPEGCSTSLGRPGSALGAENGQDPSGGGVQITFLYL